MNHLWQSSL